MRLLKGSDAHRVYVVVDVETDDDLKLRVKRIHLMDDAHLIKPSDLLCVWFSMTGKSAAEARKNCVESIAFFVSCRPEIREAVCGALDDQTAREVANTRWGRRAQKDQKDPP